MDFIPCLCNGERKCLYHARQPRRCSCPTGILSLTPVRCTINGVMRSVTVWACNRCERIERQKEEVSHATS
jgi:hypothetical protein